MTLAAPPSCLQAAQKELHIEKQQRAREVTKLAADKSSAEKCSEALKAENSALQERSQASPISAAMRRLVNRQRAERISRGGHSALVAFSMVLGSPSFPERLGLAVGGSVWIA